MKKKLLAAFLASAMVLGLVSCGGTATSSSTTSSTDKDSSTASESSSAKEESKELVPLQCFILTANTSGPVEGWWAEDVKKEVGVTLELLPSGDQGQQKLQALMASGDLPDIVGFKDYKQIENAVAGDMLLAFEDYKDLVPNLYNNVPNDLQYHADNVSNGTGKAYSIGSSVQDALGNRGSVNCGPYLRYDLYKGIGAPKIATYTDYLTVLKQMQEAAGANENGKKIYPFSIWKDWDGTYMLLSTFLGNCNGRSVREGSLAEVNQIDNTVMSLTNEDSWYLKGLKFYYDANQMGMMDPDSLSQRFEDAVGKVADGRTIFSWGSWGVGEYSTVENENKGLGFKPVPTDDAKLLHDGLAPIGRTTSFAVGKSSKNPEKAMEFINYMFSYDTSMTIINGPKGVTWDVGADNKPVVTEEGYACYADPERVLPDGSIWNKGCPFVISGYHGAVINPKYNTSISNLYWDKPSYAPADTKLQDEWQEDFKAVDQLDYLSQNDKIAIADFAPMSPAPDEMEQIAARVGDALKTLSWKMIFAKDDAEYDALKKEMQEKAIGMGIDDYTKWYADEYARAIEIGAKYSK